MRDREGKIAVGLRGRQSVITTAAQSAQALGSGSVADTFASPAMLALMEGAAVAAIEHLLAEDAASVGIAANIEHLAATPIGSQVTAEATVSAVTGRKISFTITVHDEQELVGRGVHDRVIVDRTRFQNRLAAKAAMPD